MAMLFGVLLPFFRIFHLPLSHTSPLPFSFPTGKNVALTKGAAAIVLCVKFSFDNHF